MKKSTKGLIGTLALGVAAVGGIGAIIMKRNGSERRDRRRRRKAEPVDVWARPGMEVIFRAELMPGREASERTFHVAELLSSGRVLLDKVAGEHTRKEFEALS